MKWEGGVGALSYAMLANSNAFLDIYEDNDFCQKKLKENLKQFEGRYAIISNYRTLPPALHYDFMVIDGGNKELHHPEWFFVRYLESVKAIYIEGYRRSQYAWVSRALFARHTFKTKKIKGEVIDGKFQKGGTFITCTPRHNFLLRAISYVYGRLTEDELFDRSYKFIKRALIKA